MTTDEPFSPGHAEPSPSPFGRRSARSRTASRATARARRPARRGRRGRRPPLDQHRAPAAGRPRLARGALRLPPARLRGRLLAQPAPEGRRVRRLPVHRPALPALRQEGRPAQRRRARHLRRPRLPHHAAQRAAAAGRVPVRALPQQRGRSATTCSPRAPATCSTRSSTTASTPRSRCCARWATSSSASRRRSSRASIRRDRARHLQRQAGDHQLPQDRPAAARRRSRDLERTKARYIAEDLDIYFDDINDASERVWDMLENYKEVVEGLESTNESVLAPPPQRRRSAC